MKIYRVSFGVTLYYKDAQVALKEFKKIYNSIDNTYLRSQHNGRRSDEECYQRFLERDAGIEIVQNNEAIAELMAIKVIETAD